MPDAKLAEAFARGAHAGQKHGDKPYWTHLNGVVHHLLLWGYKRDSPIVSAAWLHDTIEDTNVTYQDIKQFFGKEVAEIVWNVTDEMGRNRKERKGKTYPKIFSTPESTTLKLADLCDNVFKSVENEDKHLDMYISEWPEIRRAFIDGVHEHDLPLMKVLEDLNKTMMEVSH